MFVLPLSRTAPSYAHRAIAPQLTRALDRLFDDSVDRYFGGSTQGSRSPALDVTESDTAYTLAFDLPGVSREQLKVAVEGRRVTVESVAADQLDTESRAEAHDANSNPDAAVTAPAETTKAAAVAEPAARVLYRERSVARYARTVSLPAEVDQGASQAKLENGVLTLTLAKRVPTGATRLSIS